MLFTWAWRRRFDSARKNHEVRAFLGWIFVLILSTGLGMALYSTSLAGSTASFEQVASSPGPTQTVTKKPAHSAKDAKAAKAAKQGGNSPAAGQPAPAPDSNAAAPVSTRVGDTSDDARVKSDREDGDDGDTRTPSQNRVEPQAPSPGVADEQDVPSGSTGGESLEEVEQDHDSDVHADDSSRSEAEDVEDEADEH